MVGSPASPLLVVHPGGPPPPASRKLVVARGLNGWRVTGAEERLFPTKLEAVAFACDAARRAAARGLVGLAVVKDGLEELHCFTPADGDGP
jgi:hypothetical protein